MAPLEGWDNFYVILGSGAAALLGLTFVVIALLAERRANPAGMSGYITPTVVHFGTVLGLSCFVSMPHQNVIALSLGFGLTATGLLIYTGVISANMRRFSFRLCARAGGLDLACDLAGPRLRRAAGHGVFPLA